ncbi:MAG: Mpo1-like protein [Octadecabacter sp.]
MHSLSALLDEYDLSHRHPTNIAIHWVAEPLAVLALMALAQSVALPFGTLLWPFLALMLVYYGTLSRRLLIGLIPIVVVFTGVVLALNAVPIARWTWAAVFALSWFALLLGHKIEGRVPSVFQNPNLIFAGPPWLMRIIFRKLGLKDP